MSSEFDESLFPLFFDLENGELNMDFPFYPFEEDHGNNTITNDSTSTSSTNKLKREKSSKSKSQKKIISYNLGKSNKKTKKVAITNTLFRKFPSYINKNLHQYSFKDYPFILCEIYNDGNLEKLREFIYTCCSQDCKLIFKYAGQYQSNNNSSSSSTTNTTTNTTNNYHENDNPFSSNFNPFSSSTSSSINNFNNIQLNNLNTNLNNINLNGNNSSSSFGSKESKKPYSGNYVEVIGSDAIILYFDSFQKSIPDGLVEIQETRIRPLKNNTISIVNRFFYEGTKLFDLINQDQDLIVFAQENNPINFDSIGSNYDDSSLHSTSTFASNASTSSKVLVSQKIDANSFQKLSPTIEFGLGEFLDKKSWHISLFGTMSFVINKDTNKILKIEFIHSPYVENIENPHTNNNT